MKPKVLWNWGGGDHLRSLQAQDTLLLLVSGHATKLRVWSRERGGKKWRGIESDYEEKELKKTGYSTGGGLLGFTKSKRGGDGNADDEGEKAQGTTSAVLDKKQSCFSAIGEEERVGQKTE